MLPYVVEYLLSRISPDGGRLVMQGAHQTVVPIVPAGAQFTAQYLPVGNDYAVIIYGAAFDPTMIPGAFFVQFQSAGTQIYAMTATGWWTTNTPGTFLIVSRKEPTYLVIRNQTNVGQYYAGTAFYATIKTEGTYKQVLDELTRVGSAKQEQLTQEANKLLAALTQRLGVPRPPATGGA